MDKPTDSPRTKPSTDPLPTEKDTCGYLRVSKRNLCCWRMAGLVPYFKIGRAVRFRKSEVSSVTFIYFLGAIIMNFPAAKRAD